MSQALGAKLDEICRDILAPGEFHDRLGPAVTSYAKLLFELAEIDGQDEEQRAHLQSGQGEAIGTFWAAGCIREVKRTQRFCRGLFKAVSSCIGAGPGRPVHVIYAGTGPFAALALPTMRRFSPEEVQFSLLELNPVSLQKLEGIIATLQLEPWIRRLERCDATVWRVPKEPVDIVISETMNQALKKEPQAGIMLNFASQLDDSVIFIPESIAVGLAWMPPPVNPFDTLVDLLILDREELKRVLEHSRVFGEWVFAPVIWDYEPRDGARLVYTTFVRVFEDETLNQNDSALNLPERVSPRLPKKPARLEFRYRTSPVAGFAMRIQPRSEKMEPTGSKVEGSSAPPPWTEGQICDHVGKLLQDHQHLLDDRVRNRAFQKALAKKVTPDSVVLDIGAGTGVWAIAAALLGAKRVVAVEADELLTGLIKRLAHDCGVANRVEVVWGESTRIDLPREFDLIVSETIGYDGFEEQIVPIMVDAQARFLRTGGALIPETVGLFAAAGHYRYPGEPQPAGLPFGFRHFSDLAMNAPLRLRERRRLRLMTKPRCLVDVDLKQPPLPAVLENLQAVWEEGVTGLINCVAVWVESKLAQGVRLDTRRTTSWTPVLYPVEAEPAGGARVEFCLSLASAARWTLTVGTGGQTVSGMRSLNRAATELMMDLRGHTSSLSTTGAIIAAAFPKLE